MRASAVCAGALALVLAATVARAGEVAGRVELGVEGAALADQGPIAVYLEPAADGPLPAPSGPKPVVRQRDARFVPSFLVVAAGQTVRMANDDTIFHNVFSLSRPNDFDLGVYPAGEDREVRFAVPGLVKVYCSIHASMSATVLVVPAPWFTVASPGGVYRIEGVPAGRYEMTVWNERLPAVRRPVTVGGAPVRLDVTLGGTGS